MMKPSIQVRQGGVVTLPARVCKKYGIKAGDTLNLVDLDGLLVLSPLAPVVPELTQALSRLREAAGLDVETTLEQLQEERARYTHEQYCDLSQ